MASALEAFEDVITERFAFFKLLILAVPVYAVYYFYSINDIKNFQITLGATAFVLLTVLCCVINNVRSSLNYVMPRVFSLQFIKFAFMSVIGVLPMLALLVWGAFQLLSFDIFSDMKGLRMSYEIAVYCLLGSIQICSVMLFAKKGNPFYAYNLSLIFKHCIDCFIQVVYALFVIILLNVVVIGFILYLFALFLSLDHPAFIAICSFAVVYNVAVLAHCFAQIEYEIVPRDESEFII